MNTASYFSDRDIGFGPPGTLERPRPRSVEPDDRNFHPAPPPITKGGKAEDPQPLSSLDGNFILIRPDEQGMVQAAAGATALVRAPPPKTYDGRSGPPFSSHTRCLQALSLFHRADGTNTL